MLETFHETCFRDYDIIEKLPSKARHSKKDSMLWKLSQIRFTSPSIHLRRVGYYRKVAEQSEVQKGGNVTETPFPEQTILQQCHVRYL